MKILGLMAGTSLDGIDAALCEIEESGANLKVQLLAFECVPYETRLRDRLLRACSNQADVREVARLNVEVGEAFARAANHLFKTHGRAEIIASHGQTVAHLPGDGATLQIGEGAILAERTGATVVCNFRPRDMAAKGQGAPLVPYADWVLLRHETKNRVVLNIGGIANVSILPANCSLEEVRAWDTGPGNMAIDFLAQKHFFSSIDPGGTLAEKGDPASPFYDNLGALHPFFKRAPPKTAGREEFGRDFAAKFKDSLWNRSHDVIAQATLITAHSIAESIHDFSGFARGDYELIASGGGVHNQTLMKMLREEIAPAKLLTLEDLGFNSDAKEALCFAILGSETLRGVPTSVPGATGARRSRVLGQIVPGDNFSSILKRS